MERGFTLVELLVVIMIIGILVVATTALINPLKRVQDARVAALQSQVSSAGSQMNNCINYYDSGGATFNGYGKCSDFNKLTSASTPGGPFLKSIPAGANWTFQDSQSAPFYDGCIYNFAEIAGRNIYVQYSSLANSVNTYYDTAPTCP